MTNPKLLTHAEIESLWASLDKRDVVISSIEFRAILETCRLALRVVEAANVFLQKDSGKFSYLELESSLKPFRQSEGKGDKK